MKAKKSYGQHFLKSSGLANRIADSLVLNQTKNVLEVGPGKGILTKHLSQNADINFKAVEADQDMVSYLERHNILERDRIIAQDFLKIRLSEVFDGQSFALIGNYPYNISSQIIFTMLDHIDIIPEMVGMFQKEVADRIVAPPGSKTYGIVSVLVQGYYSGATLFDVAPDEFIPPPQVMSSVIRLERLENHKVHCDEKLFKSIVKQSFAQRRKMLRNTLKSFIQNTPLLEKPIFNQRPEQLGVEEFVYITNEIIAQRQN
ncbi:MAG: 16S rRNA (adenine(1518)-N(6)/adenine(1519)-N(6))-dimethyltransferase RsmA [Saprospiraceae bacterium]